jgi:hypothetical protein
MSVEDQSLLPRLAWHARDLRRAVGLPGAVGAAILLASLLFYAVAVLPVAAESAALAREIAALETARQAIPADGAREKPSDPVRQLAEFYRFFPKTGQAPDDLAKLHALTEIPYLSLDSVSFQRQKAGDTMLESQIKFTLFLAEAP